MRSFTFFVLFVVVVFPDTNKTNYEKSSARHPTATQKKLRCAVARRSAPQRRTLSGGGTFVHLGWLVRGRVPRISRAISGLFRAASLFLAVCCSRALSGMFFTNQKDEPRSWKISTTGKRKQRLQKMDVLVFLRSIQRYQK